MSRIIDVGLEEQSVLLNRMGDLTFETVALSIKGYLNKKGVHPQIQEMSEMLVSMADKVEDRTFELISRFQPVASDLRTIKSYMKIAYDFERYGRYALDISIINDKLRDTKQCNMETQKTIEQISNKVLSMVKISIESLKKHNITLAKTISQTETEVDQMYVKFIDNLIMAKQIDNKCIISNILMARYLERIADHATYICESIVYIATGEKISLR
jgi:phosphate transport system protein